MAEVESEFKFEDNDELSLDTSQHLEEEKQLEARDTSGNSKQTTNLLALSLPGVSQGARLADLLDK